MTTTRTPAELREQFEKWALACGFDGRRDNQHDSYLHSDVRFAWVVWQAAHAAALERMEISEEDVERLARAIGWVEGWYGIWSYQESPRWYGESSRIRCESVARSALKSFQSIQPVADARLRELVDELRDECDPTTQNGHYVLGKQDERRRIARLIESIIGATPK